METKQQDSQQVTSATPTPDAVGNEEGRIDFAGISSVNREMIPPDPWYKRLGWGLADFGLQILLFLAGFILDVLKALVQVVVGIFKILVLVVVSIGKFFRKLHRIFHEVDGYGKASFFAQGVGPFHYGQRVDGVIFFAVEVLFILFMVFNHASNQSTWFQKWQSDFNANNTAADSHKNDFSWSRFSKSGYNQDVVTGVYVESRFDSSMPEFNLDTANVRTEMATIMGLGLSFGS